MFVVIGAPLGKDYDGITTVL